ncbi:MAG: PD-(D/E)XK nuclease family protein [Lachnospiraceae bacterium]|nr:PD-(D/E)XK nuclease family protein [Lachnospiraceae bacterium]
MALKFWLGGAKSDKSRRLYNYILDEASRHPERQYLVVVPEQFGLATQRELVLGSKNHGILNIDVLSFTRLAHRISDEVGASGSDVTMLDDVGKSLIIGMLSARKKQELSVLAKNIDKLGYIDKIKSVISEFYQYGISPEKAGEMAAAAKAAGRGLLAEKLSDVSKIYSAFADYIKDRYTTVEETLGRVSRLIPDSETVKCSEVVFDGFTGFNPVQNKLIGVLMENAINVHIALTFEDCIQEISADGQIREHELFYLSRNAMNQLGRIADEKKITILDPYKADKNEINSTCNSKDKIVYTNNTSAWKLNNISVKLFAGRSPDEETGMVFSKMMALIREQGYHYRDIAILTGDVEGYRHYIERLLERHRIPFFIDTTEPILLNPFIEYIRAFIGIITENYSIPSVFRFMKSGLAGFTGDETDLLENYCLAAGIKGYKAWHSRFYAHTSVYGVDELAVLEPLRVRLVEKTDRFAAGLGEEQINAGSRKSIRQFCEALYLQIVSDGIEDKLKTAAEEFEKSGNRALSAQYGKIYVRIMDVLDELCALIPDEETDIRGFSKLLDAGLDSIRIGIIPSGMDHVQVGDLTRTRLNDIKALFIVGANDGIIPRDTKRAGIINESEREFLTGTDGIVLAPTAREEMFSQQLYIYMAVNRPSERLFVSYSRTSASGTALMPSYIVKKLIDAVPGLETERTPDIPEAYSDPEEAFEELTRFIYPAITNTLDAGRAARVVGMARYFIADATYRPRLMRILEREVINRGRDAGDSIGHALAHAIYGKKITASITRLEEYAKCAYRYFLEYAVRLKDREIFTFESKDIGNIFHDSMKTYSELMEKKGLSWMGITPDERTSLMDEAVGTVLEAYASGKLSSSARNAYMEKRIRQVMRKSADIVSSQIRLGKFTPKYFEVDFDTVEDDSALAIRLNDEDMMRLCGRIDRIDTYEAEDGVYIRVIDYKSSQHEMNLAAVYEGRQLQLLVYLDAAASIEKQAQKLREYAKEVIPAGVLYYRFDDPLIDEKRELSPGDIQALAMKKLSMRGLVRGEVPILELMDENIRQDPTVLSVTMTSSGARKSKQTVFDGDFEILSEYVNKCIREIGSDILGGNIAVPEPDNRTRFTGPDCGFCPYGTICAGRGAVKELSGDGDEEEAEVNAPDSRMDNEKWIEKMKERMEG